MKSPIIKILILITFIVVNTGVKAQIQTEKDLNPENVDWEWEYRPILADAVKVDLQASINDEGQSEPEAQEYEIPVRFLDIEYDAPELRPLGIGKMDQKDLERFFVKLGFGTQLTPLINVSFGSGRSEKFQYALDADFTSSRGSRENQIYSDAGVGLSGKYFAGPISLLAKAEFDNEVVHYYGYNEEDTSFNKDEVKQRFRRIGFELGAENSKPNALEVDYSVRAGFKSLSDINKFNEHNPFLAFSASRLFAESHLAELFVEGEGYRFNGVYEKNRALVIVKPVYNYIRDRWRLKAGLGISIDDGKFRALPDIEFSARLLENGLVFFAGWNRDVLRNNWSTISDENPFIADSIAFQNGVNELRYAGIRGAIIDKLSYNIQIGQKLVDNLPLYVNDSMDLKRFNVLYDNVNMLDFHAELGYQQSEDFSLLLALDLIKFIDIETEARAWHKPSVQWKFGGRYQVTDQLSINADVIGLNSVYAKLPGGIEEKLKGTIDINIGAEYRYSKYFNIFLDINNIAAIKYQPYYLYPTYGFGIIGGLIFSL